MGCICSKAIGRTMSIREELNHGLQSSSAAWEELLTSHSGNDQLFALVCSANTMTTKLRTSSFTFPSTDPETGPQTKNLASTWDLVPEIDRKTEVETGPDAVGETSFGRFTRSRSCQILREKDHETEGLNGSKLDWKDKNLTGSRSFHTVEEYDALLERIRKWDNVKLQESNSSDENQRSIKESGNAEDLDENQRSTKESGSAEDLNPDRRSFGPVRITDDYENGAQVDGTSETGWKRKAVAKGLKALDVSTIEFPAVARFRQRIHAEDQVYSPGTYVTPKFGSYNNRVATAKKEKAGGESSIFSPELMAAFEDCMQQLQEEEDSILSHMDGYSPGDDDEEIDKQVEEVPSNMKTDVLAN